MTAALYVDAEGVYSGTKEFRRPEMSDLARTAGQPVVVALHGKGETKTMSDGTIYKVTQQGWKKVDP